MPTKTDSTKQKILPKISVKSERLELATAISNITQIQEKFVKSVEFLGEFKSESLKNLDLEIDTKKIEIESLSEEFNKTIKDGQIKSDQHLAEYKYEGALDILKEKNEVPIKSR